MKIITLSVFLLSTAGMAHAATKPDVSKIPCASIQHFVQDMGAVVLNTGSNTFDRFVRDNSFCAARQISEIAFVAAFDDQVCTVGLRCQELAD
jgi:hypothetical protein